MLGHVAPGEALRRTGARPGDEVWVTGTIGDGALGLAALQGRVADPGGWLAGRYRLPRPRLGLRLVGVVSACMDVSDGLVQDLGHLCRAGGVAAEIRADAVPLSPAARAAGPGWLATCLTGGDDYELLMAVPPARSEALRAEAARAGVPVSRIGAFVAGPPGSAEPPGVRVRGADGREVALGAPGWSHF